MLIKFTKTSKFIRTALLFTLAALFLSVSVAHAVLYVINTDDGSVQEWIDQNIPTFQTSEDDATVDNNFDIKTAKVATGTDEHAYFLLEMYGDDALYTSSDPGSSTGIVAVAYLECGGDGFSEEDTSDRIVAYFRKGLSHSSLFGGNLIIPDDTVQVTFGDLSYLVSDVDPDTKLGQTVGANVEWSVPKWALEPIEDLTETNCWLHENDGGTGIRFATGYIEVSGNLIPEITITLLDETNPFRRFNLPTAITLNSISAYNGISPAILFAIAIATAFIAIVSGFLAIRSLQRNRVR
jgi:hypothetical protein